MLTDTGNCTDKLAVSTHQYNLSFTIEFQLSSKKHAQLLLVKKTENS